MKKQEVRKPWNAPVLKKYGEVNPKKVAMLKEAPPMTLKIQHPTQPLIKDESGIIRFKENAIVHFLLYAGPFDLNQLALMNFSKEDHEQFAQLIGYSLSGFGELSYVSDETYRRAEEQWERSL